jgi:hypothetical protein
MTESRKVNLNMNAVDITNVIGNTNRAEFEKAIGYLSTWNLTFPEVNIFSDSKDELTAVYITAEGERGYVIGAVWHEDHYGFHS